MIRFRRFLLSRPRLYSSIQSFNRRLRRKSSVEKEWRNRLANLDKAFFVQVGANDGLQGDPLREFVIKKPGWHGIFVEPLPSVFERLRKNYSSKSRFTFENVAISAIEGPREFFYLSDEGDDTSKSTLPYWSDQVGSFDREHVLNHCDKGMEIFIKSKVIESIPFAALLERHEIESVDILHIDAEGSDYEILKDLDLIKYRLKVILFEIRHMKPSELSNIQMRLERHGYKVEFDEVDGLALLE